MRVMIRGFHTHITAYPNALEKVGIGDLLNKSNACFTVLMCSLRCEHLMLPLVNVNATVVMQ